jgi:hypothetical protein
MKFICEHCGREFEATKYWAKYCSDACRVAAYKKRKKASEQLETDKAVDGLTANKTKA